MLLAGLAAGCGSSRHGGSSEAGAETGATDAARDGASDVPSDASSPSDAASDNDGGGPDDGGDGPAPCARFAGPSLLAFTLANAPFPGSGHPDVIVHVPAGFDACSPAGAVVFFHGYDDCAASVVGAVDSPCTPGGPARPALNLAEGLDAARVNAILVAVQLDFDAPTGNPGALADPGRLRDLLDELLLDHLGPLFGRTLDSSGLDEVVVAAFSGGYQAAAAAVSRGGVPQLREVDLYDALYGNAADFEGWIGSNLARFDNAATDGMRFADVYTATDGTAPASQALADRLGAQLADAGLPGAVLADRTDAALAPGDYAHPIIVKESGLAPADNVRDLFAAFTRASGLPRLP